MPLLTLIPHKNLLNVSYAATTPVAVLRSRSSHGQEIMQQSPDLRSSTRICHVSGRHDLHMPRLFVSS